MKRISLLSLLLTLPVVSGVAAPVTPAAAAAGSNIVALLAKVSGIVRITRDGSADPAPGVAGASLYAGDQITTLNGRAEIQFPGGNSLRLKDNTVLRVVPPAAPGKKSLVKTFAFLIKGSVNALVRSVSSGEGFSIRSGTAVASVKGTDFIFDGSTVLVRDEHDSQAHAVALSDAAELHTALVGEGMTAGVQGDGSISDPHAFDPADLDRQDKEFENQPQSGAASQTAAEAESDALHAELAEFAGSDDLATWSDFQERSTDLQLARVVKDRHGEWVRMQEEVLHPAPETVETLVLNQRDGGPNKGVSYYDDRITYNKALPDDGFADIYRHDYVYLWDPNVTPEYFRVTETTEFANPHGDFIQWRVAYGIPELKYDMWYPQTFTADVVSPELSHWQAADPNYDGTPYEWGQSLDESYFTGSARTGAVLKEHYVFDVYGNMVAGWYAGVNHSGETYDPNYYDYLGNPLSGLTLWAQTDACHGGAAKLYPYDPNIYDYYGYQVGVPGFDNPDFGGGFTDFAWDGTSDAITWNYADGTFLTQRVFLIDDDGIPLDFSIMTDYSRFNFEVEFEASEFSTEADGTRHSVDLVVDPAIWESGRPSGNGSNTPSSPPQ